MCLLDSEVVVSVQDEEAGLDESFPIRVGNDPGVSIWIHDTDYVEVSLPVKQQLE